MIPRIFLFSALSCLSGIATAYAMPPSGLWPLLFIGFSVFYAIHTTAQKKRTAFAYGFAFGIGYFVTGLWWIGNALLVEGNQYAWVWPISVIGLPTLLSLFTGTATACARAFFPGKDWRSFIGFCTLLTLSEYLRGTVMTGFPWNLYGYGWMSVLPMLQIASLGGAYALTLLTVFWAASPAFLLRSNAVRPKIVLGGLAAATALMTYGFGHWRLSAYETAFHDDMSVRIVQPNIAQDQKWKPEKLTAHFEHLLALSAPSGDETGTALIVWPETALAPSFVYNEQVGQKIADMLQSWPGPAWLITGAMRREEEPEGPKYYNSVIIYDAKGAVLDRYSKTHLVPFGEFIPFQQWIPFEPVVKFAGFEKGSGVKTIELPGASSLSPLICYEIIFPGKAAERKNRPDAIVNVTNDAWYGKSAGPHQHFAQTRMRAIEEGLPVLRSANTGISGVIDPLGRIVTQSGLFDIGNLQQNLPYKIQTPPLFAVTGNTPFLVLAIGFLIFCRFPVKR
jgi:apolipoprotein N-acyltransferase